MEFLFELFARMFVFAGDLIFAGGTLLVLFLFAWFTIDNIIELKKELRNNQLKED